MENPLFSAITWFSRHFLNDIAEILSNHCFYFESVFVFAQNDIKTMKLRVWDPKSAKAMKLPKNAQIAAKALTSKKN